MSSWANSAPGLTKRIVCGAKAGVTRNSISPQKGFRERNKTNGLGGWGARSGRYDRVFVHGGADAVECERFSRLTSIWPTRTDHVALLVVLRRKSGAALLDISPAAVGRSLAATSCGGSASSRVAPFSASGHEEERRVLRVAQAVNKFWSGAWGYLRKCLQGIGCASWAPGDDLGGMALPTWDTVPTEGGFKVLQVGRRKARRGATLEEQRRQCESYATYTKWAEESCEVTEAEFKALLKEADRVHADSRGSIGIPSMLRQGHYAGGPKRIRVTVLQDALLRCRALGLPRLIGRTFSELEPECQAAIGRGSVGKASFDRVHTPYASAAGEAGQRVRDEEDNAGGRTLE